MSALVETMFYVGQVPWHGQGIKLDSPPTSKEAIVASGLDWDVEARPVYDRIFVPEAMDIGGDHAVITGGNFSDTDMERVPGIQAVRRLTDGKHLGAVGPAWTPLQNREAFGWFDPLVQDGLATYHTAGSLRDGEIVWILAQIGNEAPIVGDDNIGQFLLLNMGHNGQRGINILPTAIRVVCANTLSWAESKGAQAMRRFVHSGNIVERMEDFRDVMRLFLKDFELTNEFFRVMAGTEVAGDSVDRFLNSVFPPAVDDDGKPKELSPHAIKLRDNIIAKFEGDLMGYGLIPADKKNSLWTLYNAVTEYIDHERGTDECRLNNAWFGDGAVIKKRALETAKSLVK